MAGNGEAYLRAIQADLTCPVCRYNLRGLSGELVDCPECGARIDVANLVARQWDKPWWQAPGFNLVAAPAAALVLAALVLGIAVPSLSSVRPRYWVAEIPIVYGPIVIAGWLILLTWTWSRFRTAWAVAMAFAVHLILAGMLGGAVALVVGLFRLVMPFATMTMSPVTPAQLGPGTLLVVVSLAVMWLSRRGEKLVARWCIRQHLRGAVVVD